jgi:hypothetical protein
MGVWGSPPGGVPPPRKMKSRIGKMLNLSAERTLEEFFTKEQLAPLSGPAIDSDPAKTWYAVDKRSIIILLETPESTRERMYYSGSDSDSDEYFSCCISNLQVLSIIDRVTGKDAGSGICRAMDLKSGCPDWIAVIREQRILRPLIVFRTFEGAFYDRFCDDVLRTKPVRETYTGIVKDKGINGILKSVYHMVNGERHGPKPCYGSDGDTSKLINLYYYDHGRLVWNIRYDSKETTASIYCDCGRRVDIFFVNSQMSHIQIRRSGPCDNTLDEIRAQPDPDYASPYGPDLKPETSPGTHTIYVPYASVERKTLFLGKVERIERTSLRMVISRDCFSLETEWHSLRSTYDCGFGFSAFLRPSTFITSPTDP